jgi:hypothetical protein
LELSSVLNGSKPAAPGDGRTPVVPQRCAPVFPRPRIRLAFALDGSRRTADYQPSHEHFPSGGKDALRRLGAGGMGSRSGVGAFHGFVFTPPVPEGQLPAFCAQKV